MAYPNKMKIGNNFGQKSEIFEWWKAAINAQDVKEGFGPEFYTNIGQYFPAFPFNRSVFYNWLQTRWSQNVFASSIYSQPVPVTGWSTTTVIKWGKFKAFELALFGNVNNGINDGAITLPVFNSNTQGRYGVNGWSANSLTYMRYALTRFDTYGSCMDGGAESGSDGPSLEGFFYTLENIYHSEDRWCSDFEEYSNYDRVTFLVSIVNSSGGALSVHPDFTFKFINGATEVEVLVINNGTSTASTIFVTSDCRYSYPEPVLVAPISQYLS